MKRVLIPATALTILRKSALAFLCSTALMVLAATAQTPQQIKADPGTNNPPPAGAILDLASPPQAVPGGGNGTYLQYGVNFTATVANTACGDGCTTAITFAFRDDPAFISFANAAVTDLGVEFGPNLLTNGDFSGGTHTSNGNSSTPIGWTYANVYGATFGGFVNSGCGTDGGNCWYDGAVQAYDAISQTIPITLGHTYHISFFVAENSGCGCNFSDTSTNGDSSDTGGNGINVTVYAQAGLPSGGFPSVTHTLSPGVQTIYTFPGKNDPTKITPSPYSMGGETLTVTAVPILKSNFVPPANFPNETCVPFADYSAANGADTCVGFQFDCSFNGVPNGGDCTTLLYQLLESYDLPPDLPAIGGPDFLVVHGSGCPTSRTAVAQSIFTDYIVARQDPTTKGGGAGTGSCFEVMYTPTAAPITSGSTSRFVGFASPVVDTALNVVKAGSTRPLAFQWLDNVGNPVTNLTWCASPNPSPGSCTAPWVNLQYFSISCVTDAQISTATDVSAPGNSGFQNLGGGNYQMNWKTSKGWTGCANVQATFDNGVVTIPAVGFQFK